MVSGILYLIPTPLGACELSWVIPDKAKELVAHLDCFVVEHPKTARAFLKQLGYATPALQQLKMQVLDEHTRPSKLAELLSPLMAGKNMGLLSEAGCPGVADPGASLVRLAHQKNIRVVPLAGPSAILLALMASGLNGQRFAFHGYLPVEQGQRVKKIAELETESIRRDETQIFIETPYRNQKLLESLMRTCRNGTALCLATDITLASEAILTRTVWEWKGSLPDIGKRPTVFLLHGKG